MQQLVHASDEVLVTYQESVPVTRPMMVNGRTVLEPNAPVVWFTFPGRSYDVGRFHLSDGSFTGIYANIIQPVRLDSATEWSTTDLFVDVWIGNDGEALLLDLDELEHAVTKQWLAADLATQAVTTANAILEQYEAGRWPPSIVNEWTLARVRKRV